MSAHRSWRRKPWKADAEFRVPSAAPGIAFQVGLILQGVRPRRMPENRAIALARSMAVETVAATVERYSVLTAEAAAITATAACLAVRSPWRGLRIEHVVVTLDSDATSALEARQLDVLRRTARVAGTAAVFDAARAEALRHVVLADHDTTVAHLLAAGLDSEGLNDLSTTAADLRRNIDDHRPDGRWIRVAEVFNELVKDKSAAEIKDMIEVLAGRVGHYSPDLARHLINAADETLSQGR